MKWRPKPFTGATAVACTALLFAALACAALARPAAARDALGGSGKWAAFHDAMPQRCFAIAEPEYADTPDKPEWRPFMAVSDWPQRRIHGQVHMRLSKPRKPGTTLRLTVGAARFEMVSAGAESWPPDSAADSAIIAAMRVSKWAVIQGTARDGTRIRDAYSLSGAATAIDAARLACAAKR